MDVRGAVWLKGPPRNVRETGTPANFQTFALLRPRKTHWKEATCAEYGCDDYKYGFVFTCDTSTELGQKQFHYVTHDRTRRHSMQRVGPTMFKFVYGPGFDGFGHRHVLPLWRPPKAIVFGGDWRGQTSAARVHTNVEDWVDESLNHHDRIATIRQRG